MVLTRKPKSYAEAVDNAIDIEEGLRNRRSRARPHGAQGGRPAVQGAQSSQSSQSAHQPQQQQQPSGRQRFRPRQFKKKSGSGSSGSGSSSSSGSRAEFCGYCGGKHPSTQCVGVNDSCNICGQYGHFARVCPSAGSKQAAAPPQGQGGSSRVVPLSFRSPRFERLRLVHSSSLVRRVSDSHLSSFSLDLRMLRRTLLLGSKRRRRRAGVRVNAQLANLWRVGL
ncbi:hypothetical protein F511_23216 [Dorcoceras hygrometricum]|uniref:CCHC-type domain-containing protein n=1 Tax=Dorcoceras hygrometricum TaxID=472368 RepID=A0A2Z7BHH3_9LAMI|nr:hypothetical protein F511_23216 [Dorcoceras hygrometricum]